LESTFCLLAVSKIYRYCFIAAFGGAGFLIGMWFVSFFIIIIIYFSFFVKLKPVCLVLVSVSVTVSSSGGVTTSPVSKGLQEYEEVNNLQKDWVKVLIFFHSLFPI